MLSLIWRLAWPLRWYVTRAPLQIGTATVKDMLSRLLPPAPSTFTARLPVGSLVELEYREAIGLHTLLYGSFEAAEIQSLCSWARPNSTALDVGANVGLFTVALAEAVRPAGKVIAFEPFPGNIGRLKGNLELNNIRNVDVLPLAVGREEGTITLHLSRDPAFHSTTGVRGERPLHETITVPTSSLDHAWKRKGLPRVSVVKIDVEGGELSVLSGASALLESCRPVLLVEIPEEEQLEEITTLLRRHGYRAQQPRGFMPWNFLFIADARARADQREERLGA